MPRYIVATRARRSERFEVIDTQPETGEELPGVGIVAASSNHAGMARRLCALLNRHGPGRKDPEAAQ